MPCENIRWGYWRSGLTRGTKYHKINPNPYHRRAKLIIDGDWYYNKETNEKICRHWTEEEINSGYGITKKHGKVKLVPIKCNHCDQCRLERSNEWVTRIMCEYETAGKKGCKIDLTYAPEYVPDGYVLSIADYQQWIKRLRMHLKRHDPEYKGFTYYIGGEYGPNGGRPHYHIIIIGWEPNDMEYWKDSKTGYPMYKSDTIQNKTWKKGICTIEPLTPETVSYATRYTNKKSGKAKTNKSVTEFQRQSQNIGLDYWNLHKEEIKDDTGIWIKKQNKAKLVKIPRYFKKKWQEENPVEYEYFTDWSIRNQEKEQEKKMAQTDKCLIDQIKDSVETSKIIYNLLRRENLDTDEQTYYANENTKQARKKLLQVANNSL